MSAPIILDHTGSPARKAFGLYDTRPTSQRNSYIPSVYNQDIEALVSEYDRTRLLSIGRALYATTGPVFGAVNEIATYSVGTAFQPIFIGEDQEWGQKAVEFLLQWYEVCDVRGQPYDLVTNLWLASVAIDRDGDVACILTHDGDDSWPLLQFIPSHRIATRDYTGIMQSGSYRGLKTKAGVIYNKSGRPVAINITGETPADDRQISMRDAALIYEPQWVDQGRGISGMAATVREWQDVDSVSHYTKEALKALASIAVIEDTESGSADPNDDGFEHFTEGNGVVASGVTVEDYYGGSVRYFKAKSGAGLKTLEHNRPAMNSQEFMKNWVLRAAFSGLGWPIEFAFDSSALTGPGVRLIIGKAARKVEARQRRLISLWLRVIPYALAKAIKTGRIPANKEWLSWDMTLPRMLTIDYGRESSATNLELRSGVTTMSEIVGRDGRDWRDVVRSRVNEQRFIMDECAKAGVEPSTVSDLFPPKEATVSNEGKGGEKDDQ